MTFRAEFEHHDDLRLAALEEFCTRGYDAASINRILSVSGVSKGQLYHHFTDKEALYLALVEWMIDAKVAWFSTNPFELSPDPITALSQQIRAAVDFAVAHPHVDRFTRALLAERGRPIYAAVVARFGFDTDSPIGTLVQQAHREATLRNDISPQLLERVVVLLINHLPDLLDLHAPTDLEAQLDELLRFLRVAIGPAKAPSRS